MNALPTMLLALGVLWPADLDQMVGSVAADPPRLREMLYDRQHPRNQNQAALLLVLNHTPEVEEMVRQALKQTDSPDVFMALTAALRLSRDGRFNEELLLALSCTRLPVRQDAADTLALLADPDVAQRLRALVEDARADAGARQLALATLGRSGQKAAAGALIDQLAGADEVMRQAAIAALTELTGQTYGAEVGRWQAWWKSHKDMLNERWLDERLAYQVMRDRRLEGELERARAQVLRLHQQLYARLPSADRLSFVQNLVDHEDPAVRAQAVSWCAELLTGADAVGQRTLGGLLLRFSRDATLEVQRPAVAGLGRVNDPRAFEQVRLLLERGAPTVRAAAAHALAQQALNQARAPKPDPSQGPDTDRMRQVVPLLQKALDDPALEVVVAAAEDLGMLGVPEAGPVLAALLRHASDSVRQTVAVALERVADARILDSLLLGLDDSAALVRFSMVGAIAHAAGDNQGLSEVQRARALARLEELVLRDPDTGVRSRAAMVLGLCGPPSELAFLYRRVMAREDARVQEKAWAAVVEIIARSGSMELLHEWDRNLAETKQRIHRLQLLSEVYHRWKKNEATKGVAGAALEALVQAQLEEGKWAATYPLVRELLARPGTDSEVDRRLRWLLTVGELALQEGKQAEALLVVQEAQPFLARRPNLAVDFDKLEKRARN